MYTEKVLKMIRLAFVSIACLRCHLEKPFVQLIQVWPIALAGRIDICLSHPFMIRTRGAAGVDSCCATIGHKISRRAMYQYWSRLRGLCSFHLKIRAQEKQHR